MINLNKLFPRLPIRAKLGIAFVLLSLIPLALVAVLTTRATILRLRSTASANLEREVQTARTQVEQTLSQVEHDVTFLSDAYLANLITTKEGTSSSIPASGILTGFLEHTAPLFRMKVIAADGRLRYEVGIPSPDRSSAVASGMYYAWRARSLAPGNRLVIPVELRMGKPADPLRTLPAVAVLVPVWTSAGTFAGVVVGEARAATLFAGLERVPSALRGTTTGLVDADRHFLYHSERKRTWASLLGAESDTLQLVEGLDALPPAGVSQTGQRLAAVTLVRLGTATPALRLFRTVPMREVDRPVREFLLQVAVTGAAMLLLVGFLAAVAARQLTTPIYRLRDAASRLHRGDPATPLRIATNDELEDLAADFQSMAEALASQRRQLEDLVSSRTRELRETNAQLAGILEHSADAIVGLDTEGRIQVWNRGAEVLFGYTSTEVAGKESDALWFDGDHGHPAERDYLRRELKRRGAVVNFQTRRRTRDGRLIPVSLTQTLHRDETNRPMGTSLILRDISLQTSLEDQMRRSERLAAMSVMAAGLAHEINNPLAIIGNRLECMEAELREIQSPTLAQDLAVLRDHTTRLGRLIQNLLRFAGDPGEQLEPVDIAAMAQRLAGLLEQTLASRNVRMAVSVEGAPVVLGATAALETVLLNLVLNAADAMPLPQGGAVRVEAQGLERTVRLAVSDQGPGVPEELRERIFEPFFTTKGKRGTGLGLSLCRSIVERHGGRIWVEGPCGRGNRFVAELPAMPEARV